ncbi:LamG-like jellyroll fold domain-containing protein [Streptomyces sp. SJL17-1]|uniref:LamG-like jellyroll fold domain-containing protein n=1 Tax=Streptomyces sp. SJL17-1 TaxID=2967223 RepID=UPI0029672862|nr:LamG-like jellyroll fold domain-containing protein [Streptomyces sp. SJL17-1]
MLTTETAMATGATLTPVKLPQLSLSGLWKWVNEPSLDTPDQQGGTAAGKSHRASADATSLEGEAGRKPGKAKGELPPFERETDDPADVTTGKAPGDADSFDARTSRRDAKKSSASSDFFVNADGSTTVRHYAGRSNFKTADGTWKPIDTSLTEDRDGRLQQTANSLDIEFAPTAADRQLASVDFGSGRSLAYSLRGAATSEPTVNANGTVTYAGVLPDTDVQLVPLAEGFKENIVLRSPDAASSWVFPLDAKGLTPRIAADGDVEFTDAAGAVTATVPHAFMEDSRIDPRSGDAAQSRAVSYELTTVDGKPALRMTADRAWLAAPERVYPVTVDPTVTASNSTYTQNTIPGDHSTESMIKVGSYDAGTNKTNSFLQFPSLGTALKGQRVSAATLNVYALWSSTCPAQEFSVHPISQAWTPSGVTSYPGPAYGAAIGTATPAAGASCSNDSNSPGVGVKMPVTLSTDWFTYVATGGANHGLALTAPTNDNLHWKKFHSDNSATADFRPALDLTYTANTKPQVNAQYPPENFQAHTLQPELLVYASDADGWPDTLSYSFQVYDADNDTTPVASSGVIADRAWKVPAGKLAWSKNYNWYVSVTDGYDSVLHSASRFSTAVPQPPVTSGLAQNTDGHDFDPSDGNYTMDETDADVTVIGPSLEIERSYNSLDPRTDNAFGAGWSTVVDMKAAENKDGASTVTSVVITYPGGEQVAFGRNSNGTFVPPRGRYARLEPVTGGYKLTDKDFTAYSFTQATGKTGLYAISGIVDYAGRAETFTYNASRQLTKITNTTSKRSLTLAWATPSGATAAHVVTVATDAAVVGDASTVQTWKYGYAGDQLTGVCPPADATKCTAYTYTTGNHHRTTVLDADPYAYWRLGEAAGETVSKDTVDVNQGKYNGLYRNVALGSTSLLAGSTQKTATFNGITSYVEMPSAPGATPSYTTISTWFRTTQAGGVLVYYGDKPLSDPSPVANTTYNTPALYVGTDGKLRGCLATGTCGTTIASAASVNDGKWHQAVLTGAGTTQTLYLDGVAQGSKAGQIKDWNTPYIALGAGVNNRGWPAMNAADPLGHFSGQLAEAAIYTEPLTADVITAQYQAAFRAAGLLDSVTSPGGRTQASVVYGATDDLVLQATDANGGTWKLNPATITGSSQVYRSAVMGSAPAGYWRLGDTQGAAQAANELHTGFGTYNTVTQGVAGPFGADDNSAASFNGTSSYAELPYGPLHAKRDRSVELWFKTAEPGVIMSDQSLPIDNVEGAAGTYSELLYVGADGKLHGHWWTSACNATSSLGSTATVTDNTWHHAVLASAGTTQTLYLDGVKQGSCAAAPDDQSNTRTFIGAGFGKGWFSSPGDVSRFTGSIAEVAVYQSGLSEDDVARHWSAYKASSGVAPVRTVKLTDPKDKTLTYVYDAEMGNRLLAAIDTEGKRTTYGYDMAGFLHTVTDANGNRSITGHDVRGNAVSRTTCQDTLADRCSTEYFTYYPDATTAFPPMDPRNDVLLTERDGRSSGPTDNTYLTTHTYDAGGNVTAVTSPPVAGYPSGRTTSTVYTTTATPAAEGGTAKAPAGLVAQVITPGGKKTSYTYFANGDLAETLDANGAKEKYTYDNIGREVTETEVSDSFPAGLTATQAYDKNDRIVTETGPRIVNRVTGATHQARTTTAFDPDGNVLSQTQADLIGGDTARTTSMTYDERGRLRTKTDPGGDTTSYEYDVYGNKVKETDPAGNINVFTFDAERRPLTAGLQNWTGDPNNPSAPSLLVRESRAYDPAGRLASVTDAMGWVTAYTYTDDGLSATVVRKDPQSGKSFTEQANTYDAAGNLIEQVTDDGRVRTTLTVDAADRTTRTVLDPNGLARSTTVSYDPDDRVVTETETDPATGDVDMTDMRYDDLGNVRGVTVHDGTTAPVARYKLDETTGSGLADSSGGNSTATHGTGVRGSTDRGGSAVFDGVEQSYAQTDDPVVNTAGSFTVSAWAKLSDLTAGRTVLSQNGDHVYGFVLYYAAGTGWVFARPRADVAPVQTFDRAVSAPSAAVAGAWTHLAGVYDAQAAKLRLYVNGTLAQEVPYTSPWEATGPLQIGRHGYGTDYDYEFKGGIDDVQVYAEALTPAQITAVKGGTLPAAGSSVRTTTSKLDQRGLPLSTTDENGTTTDYGYDEAGRATSVTEPLVDVEQNGGTPVSVRPVTMTGYNTFGEQTETSDALGNVTAVAYDAEGRETSTTLPPYTPPGGTAPITATSWTEYDTLGLLKAEVDEFGNRTAYTYTQLGEKASVTDPRSGVTTYTYDTNGDELSATRPNGARQESTWDYLGRRLTTTDIVRQPTQRAYTVVNEYDAPGGELSRVLSASGIPESYAYNVLGEKTAVTDASGDSHRFTYDMDGHVLTSTDPDGTSNRNTYDPFGQLVKVEDLDAQGTVLRTAHTTFDRAGNVTSTTDYRGHTTTLTTDASGAVTKAVQPVSTTESITTTFGYDAEGNRTRFTDGRGNAFLTTYNSWGRVESEIEPATPSHPEAADRTFTTVYDAGGRAKEGRSPGGVTVVNEYDAEDRLVRQSGTGAEAITADRTYTYDSDDRLTSVAGAGDVKNTFTYDDRGLLLSTAGPSGDSSFAYNGDGLMTSRTDASGTTTYGYDTDGRLRTAADASTGTALTYTYDVDDRVKQIDYGAGGSRRTFSYDALERVTEDRLTSPAGKVLSSIAYGWDENGNETSKTTTGVVGAATHTYTYDWADRLTSWNNGTATESYGYDASGNRTRVGTDTYTYDARNRLMRAGGDSYMYTARGSLSQVASVGGGTVAVKADAFNRVIGEGGRTYTYDGFDRVLEARDEMGTALFSFAYSGVGNDVASDGGTSYSRNADGSLLGVKTPVSSVLALTDLHTDVVAQFTAAGEALTGSRTYSPFGEVSGTSGILGGLGYQSGWTDPESGKVNMAARWYAPEVGRFTSRDTVSLSPLPESVSANRYAYANDNPMSATDPTGHWPSFFNKVKKAVKSAGRIVAKAIKKPKTHRVVKVIRSKPRGVTKLVSRIRDGVKKIARYAKAKAKKAVQARLRIVKDPRYLANLAKANKAKAKRAKIMAIKAKIMRANKTKQIRDLKRREHIGKLREQWETREAARNKVAKWWQVGVRLAYDELGPTVVKGGLAARWQFPGIFGSEKDPTGFQLGLEWASGSGPKHRDLDGSHQFTKTLQDHYHVQSTKNVIARDLLSGDLRPGQDWTRRKHALGSGNSLGKLAKDFHTNSSAAFLGSYELDYKVTGVNKATGQATVIFRVQNKSHINSATHGPPSMGGYDKWWTEKIGNPLKKHYSTGRFSETTQEITWTDTVTAKAQFRR